MKDRLTRAAIVQRFEQEAGWLGSVSEEDVAQAAVRAGCVEPFLPADMPRLIDELRGIVRVRTPAYRIASLSDGSIALVFDPKGGLQNYQQEARLFRRMVREATDNESLLLMRVEGVSVDRQAARQGISRRELQLRRRQVRNSGIDPDSAEDVKPPGA